MAKSRSFGVGPGISTGLRYALFFVICFYLMGYPVLTCVFLATLGGISGGWVISWLKSKEQPTVPEPIPAEALEDNRSSGIRLANQLRSDRNRRSFQRRRRAREDKE